MKNIIVTLLFMVVLVGCANTDANLKFETSRSIGNVLPEDVELDNVDRGLTSVKWDAKIKTALYKCNADDMLRRVNCIKH